MVTIVHDTLKLRKKAGLQRSAVARATGISYGQLRRIEVLGKPVEVTEGQANKLAQMLGVTLNDLVEAAAAAEPMPPPQTTGQIGTPEQAFKAGAHAILRQLLKPVDDHGRQTVRELVEAAWHTYLLGQQLRS